MLFHYRKIGEITKESELLNDLVKIHNDRISAYKVALGQSVRIDVELREAIERFVSDGAYYKEQLVEKIREQNTNAANGTTIFGKIYMVWMELKVTLSGSTQRSLLNSCIYNEEIALHVFTAALDSNVALPRDIRLIIKEHEDAIRRTIAKLKNLKMAPHHMDKCLMYFV